MNSADLGKQLTDIARKGMSDVQSIVVAARVKGAPQYPPSVTEFLKGVNLLFDKLRSVARVLDARAHASQRLAEMNSMYPKVDGGSPVTVSSVPYASERLMGFQAYLANAWSAYDMVADVAYNLGSPFETFRNPNLHALLRDVVIYTKNRQGQCHLYDDLFYCYGWPVLIGSTIRNSFFHAGGIVVGEFDATPGFCCSMFVGDESSHGFMLSDAAHTYLISQADRKENDSSKRHSVTPACCLGGWDENERDLLKILQFCEREIDEAVIALAAASTESAVANTKAIFRRYLR